MARTAGAISNVSIKFADLCKVIGAECPDSHVSYPVVVSVKWLNQLQRPCEMVTITAEELERLNAGLGDAVSAIETTPANSALPSTQRAAVMFEIPEL